VQDAICDDFAEKLAAAVRKLNPAPGLDRSVTQGPLIDDRAVEKVESHIQGCDGEGARVLVGGMRHALGGRIFAPTLLAGHG
jgi:succinate-semialdehyde dehydrogenase/glutarate-semialdehyde dehydrogenase